jgi:hypothetical protein
MSAGDFPSIYDDAWRDKLRANEPEREDVLQEMRRMRGDLRGGVLVLLTILATLSSHSAGDRAIREGRAEGARELIEVMNERAEREGRRDPVTDDILRSVVGVNDAARSIKDRMVRAVTRPASRPVEEQGDSPRQQRNSARR